MKNISIVIILSLVLFSCDLDGVDQSFVKNELGLNIELIEETYGSLEKKPGGKEMYFDIYNYKTLGTESLFKKGFPKRPNIPKGWKTVKWKKTSSSDDVKRLAVIVSYDYDKIKTKEKVLKMKQLISEGSSFYSYSYKEKKDNIVGLQLFLLDASNSEFYEYNLFK